MTSTLANSRPERRQLGDQIDRLDAILDGLADALNEAVADAAREGVSEAVVQLLTNAELRAQLHQAAAAELPPRPTFLGRIARGVERAVSRVKQAVTTFLAGLAARGRAAATAVGRAVRAADQTAPVRAAARVFLAAAVLAVFVRHTTAHWLGIVFRVPRAVVWTALADAARWSWGKVGRLGVA